MFWFQPTILLSPVDWLNCHHKIEDLWPLNLFVAVSPIEVDHLICKGVLLDQSNVMIAAPSLPSAVKLICLIVITELSIVDCISNCAYNIPANPAPRITAIVNFRNFVFVFIGRYKNVKALIWYCMFWYVISALSVGAEIQVD